MKYNIEQLLQSQNFADRWREREANEEVPSTILRAFFGARKQYEAELSTIRGVRKSPITLSPSQLDANTLPLQRGSFEITKKEMPYFKNFLKLGEKDARRLADALNSNNDERIKMVMREIYDDRNYLVDCGRVTVDTMLSQLMTTGAIVINANGVALSFDYGIGTDQKKSVGTGVTAAWTDFANSTPIDDIQDAIEERAVVAGVRPNTLTMNTYTFNLIRKSQSVKDLLIDGLNLNKLPSIAAVKSLFLTELQVTLYISDDMYATDAKLANGRNVMAKHFPDGVAVLHYSEGFGDIVYTLTPEEISAELGAPIDFEIVDNGICISVDQHKDIVQTIVKGGVSALPDVPGADSLVIFSVKS